MNIIDELMANAPVLSCGDKDVEKAFEAAKYNLFAVNTVPCDMAVYNSTGRIDRELPYIIKAGGFYQTPWTRDSSINSWAAGNLLEPTVARNTMMAQCEKTQDGRLVIARDNQVWDNIVWTFGAWHHYLVTGDETFFTDFYEILCNALADTRRTRFNGDFGLYFGGSFFNDGISAYPQCLDTCDSDFMGDHPKVETVMCLSTNCIYYGALRIGILCAEKVGDTALTQTYKKQAEDLRATIRKTFINPDGTWNYLLFADGSVCKAQEAFGTIFAIQCGVCEADEAKPMLQGLERGDYGIMTILPPFEGVSTVEKPGRHNNTIWPFVNGFLIDTAARAGAYDVCFDELRKFTDLVKSSDFHFFEVYNGYTGEVFGGWQKGVITDSQPDQTWSATAYIKAIINGIIGLDAYREGARLNPCVPEFMKDCALNGVKLGKATFHIQYEGFGTSIRSLTVNGKAAQPGTPFPIRQPAEYHIRAVLE